MKYKVYLNAIKCNRKYSSFIRNCDLGISDIGIPVIISFTLNEEPTDKLINKIIECHERIKFNNSLNEYFTQVKLNRIEVIK